MEEAGQRGCDILSLFSLSPACDSNVNSQFSPLATSLDHCLFFPPQDRQTLISLVPNKHFLL